MSKQVINQLIDSSLSLLAAIKTIMEDTPHALSVEAARAQMIAIKAMISPSVPQLTANAGRNSAAEAITGYADREDGIKPPVKVRKKEIPDKVASTECVKRMVLKAMRYAGKPMTNKEITKLILNRPSTYELDGRFPKAGIRPVLCMLHKSNTIIKKGERNWCTYELPQSE
jgi:hypothetical protein